MCSFYLILSQLSWKVQFMGKKIELSIIRGSWYFLRRLTLVKTIE
jgi:hypothetical protein